jgi:RHS repeat-associated protein
MHRAGRVVVSCVLLSSALLARDFRQGDQTIQLEKGFIQYAGFVITGGLPSSLTITLTPDPVANHYDLSCNGSGFNTINVAWNFNGATTYQVPLVKTSPGLGTLNCVGNYGTLPNTDYATTSFSVQVSDTGFTSPGNLASDICDPIATSSGELHITERPDLSLGGPLPLSFSRVYGTLINANGTTTRIGNNWMHNFEWLLVLNGKQAQVTFYGGQTIAFVQTGSTWQLASPARYGYQFAGLGNNTYQFLDPRSNLIYTFSGTGNTLGNTSVQDRNGNTLTIALPSNGSSTVSDGLGRTLTITYDANGKLVKIVDQSGRSVSYGYTGNNLTQFTNANGKITNYAYTTAGVLSGLLTATTLPLGNKPVSQTFDSIGRVATQSDSFNNTTTLTYDQPVGLTSFKDPLGAKTIHVNRNYSDLLTYTDPDNQSVAITYDANGHRTSVTDRLGNKVTETYHSPSGYLATVTDVNGNTNTNTWVAQTVGPFTFYVLSKVQYADGSSISYTYDASGNMLTATDQLGKVSKTTYNARGQALTRTDATGHVTTYVYNASDGTLASVTDAAGNTTTYSYDTAKRVSQIRFADTTTESFTYDGLDNIIKTTDANGKSRSTSFNDNNHPLGRTDALGKPTSIFYDTEDRVVKRTDRLGQSTSFEFNELGLQKSVTTPAGEKFTTTYDSHHRESAALDPSGKGLTFAYDKEDALASVTDPLSRKTTFTTDKFGALTNMLTPSGGKYSFNRDKSERYTGGSDPAGVLTSILYDARGAMTYFAIGSFAGGSPTQQFSYNDAGQLTKTQDPNGGTWSYGYDQGGRLGLIIDPLDRHTNYSYDKRNRVNAIQTAIGQLSITYDGPGNLTRRLYTDGTDLNYTFDDNHRLIAGPGATFSYDANGAMTGSNGLGITRDANGRIASITYATGKTVRYAYNAVGLLASVTDWVAGSTTFTYDAAHQLVAMKRPNGLGTQYTYDLDGRVASITEDAGSSIVIKRDAAGKKISETRTQPQSVPAAPLLAAGVSPLTFDGAHQVTGFTYDSLGRLNQDAIRKYTWDLASRLQSYAGLDGSATAGYDGFGLRTSVNASSGARIFIWNYATSLPTLATVQDATANPATDRRYYVYSPDGALLYAIDAAVTNGTNARHFYHFDELGSTTLLTNDAGAITDSYAITPYGETVTANGSTENPFTWLGQFGVMQESSTGLYHMRQRYYDSATARFLSQDPIASGDPLQSNPYRYARANPLAFVDPSGLMPEVIPASGLGNLDGESLSRLVIRGRDPLAFLSKLPNAGYVSEELLNSGLRVVDGEGRGEGGRDGVDPYFFALGGNWNPCGPPIGTGRIKIVELVRAVRVLGVSEEGSSGVSSTGGLDFRRIVEAFRQLAPPTIAGEGGYSGPRTPF